MGYIMDNAVEGELQRLRALEEIYDPTTRRHLAALEPRSGWRCLEVGAGRGSIARWLCERVTPHGSVVATDIDTRFLDAEPTPGLEARKHEIIGDALEEGAFDLVHSRLLLEHLPARADVLAKLYRAVKPGGWLVIEDSDWTLLRAPAAERYHVPQSAWPIEVKVVEAFLALFDRAGVDWNYGRQLPQRLLALGLDDVHASLSTELVRGGSSQSVFYRMSTELVRAGLRATNLSSHELETWQAHLADPATAWMNLPLMTAWGRKPLAR